MTITIEESVEFRPMVALIAVKYFYRCGQIFFVLFRQRWGGSRRGSSGHSKLFSRTTQGGWERPILPPENRADTHSYYSPAYSPDGQRIAYEKHGTEGHIVHVALVSGSRSIRIDNESEDQHNPVWSPDGSWILYSRQKKGVWEIAQVSSDGSKAPTTLTGEGVLPAGLSKVAWSPIGGLIAYTSPEGLRLLTRDGERQRVLTPQTPVIFGFSKTGLEIIALRRTDRSTARIVHSMCPRARRNCLARCISPHRPLSPGSRCTRAAEFLDNNLDFARRHLDA